MLACWYPRLVPIPDSVGRKNGAEPISSLDRAAIGRATVSGPSHEPPPPNRPVLHLHLRPDPGNHVIAIAGTGPYLYYPGVGTPNVPGTTSPYPNQVVSFTQPSADNQVGNVPPAQLNVREQRPNDFQTEVVRPIPVTAGYPNSFLPSSQPWTGSQPERVAQNSAGLEIIRPGVPAVQGVQPSSIPPSGVKPPSEPAPPTQAVASPFDPTQFRLPTLGLPPGLGTPEPTPEIKREYGQFVEREITPENTIQVIVGRAKVIVLRENLAASTFPMKPWLVFRSSPTSNLRSSARRSAGPCLTSGFPIPAIPTILPGIGP